MTDKVQKIREEVERLFNHVKDSDFESDSGAFYYLKDLLDFIDSLQEEPVSIWHDASEEPNDISHCLVFYGCKESVGHYLHYEPVLYNKKEKMFVTSSLPHPTGYKRDRISISDITQWCYLCDLHNLSNVQRTVKDWKEPVSEDFEKAAKEEAEIVNALGGEFPPNPLDMELIKTIFIHGAKWGMNQAMAEIQSQSMALAHGCTKKPICDDCVNRKGCINCVDGNLKETLPNEPVSEDLVEAAYHNCIDRLSKESIEDFKAGAEWKKQQTIEKACKWIDENAAKYLVDRFVGSTRVVGIDTSITEDFRKDMED